MELDWRNRCVGGERLEDLYRVVQDLGAHDNDELFELVWWDPHTAMPFHRALLRVAAEVLWQRAAGLRPWQVYGPASFDSLEEAAFTELLRRAGIELERSGLGADQ